MNNCLRLVLNDLCEAMAADRMLSELLAKYEMTKCLPKPVTAGIIFIEHALAIRMALAVNRLLQPTKSDRATLMSFFKSIESNINASKRAELRSRIDTIRDHPDAKRLRECRDGFIAHTLVGEFGVRDGMLTDSIDDLLYELIALVKDMIEASGGDRSTPNTQLEHWREIGVATWSTLLRQ